MLQPCEQQQLDAIAGGEDNPAFLETLMKLSTDLVGGAQRAQLPALYGTERDGDAALVRYKVFTPWSNWTWYITEFDGTDICFGLVDGFESELGNFSLAELSAIRGPRGLRIERDLHWRPKPLGEVRRAVAAARGH